MKKSTARIHASWPLICFAKGMVMVMLIAVTLVMFNRLGISNTVAAAVTSLLLLPMAFRPLLAPLVETAGRRKWWMTGSLIVFAGAMYVMSGYIRHFPENVQMWVALILAALAGACFDAAAAESGWEVLEKKNYGALKILVPCKLMAVVIVMGVMMLLAGNMEVMSRNIGESWEVAFKVGAAIALAVALLLMATLRQMRDAGKKTKVVESWQQRKKELKDWWKSDRKRWLFVLFTLFFTLHEFFLWKGTLLFLVDRGSIGGLSLSPQEMGFAFCTVATVVAMAGYVMGMECLRKNGMKKWWWPMVLAYTAPDAIYVFLAYAMPGEMWLVSLCLSVEQWCCGFGTALLIIYIMYGNREQCPKTHLDMCWTMIVASIVLSGSLTGVMQDYLGYRRFFIVIMLLALVALVIAGTTAMRRKE